MRVPFPLALSVGTDITAYNRFVKPFFSEPARFQRFVHRILHPQEIVEFTRRYPKWASFEHVDKAYQQKVHTWLAGRWAAKEAAKKAWGAHLISWKDLRTEILPSGEVQVICQSFNPAAQYGNDKTTSEQVGKLSISHDGDYAVATVIAAPLHPDIVSELSKRKSAALTKVDKSSPNPKK